MRFWIVQVVRAGQSQLSRVARYPVAGLACVLSQCSDGSSVCIAEGSISLWTSCCTGGVLVYQFLHGGLGLGLLLDDIPPPVLLRVLIVLS